MIKPNLDMIQQISASDLGRHEFGQVFLETLCEITDADAGAVWDAADGLQVIAQFAKGNPTRLNLTRKAHDSLLSNAATADVPVFVRGSRDGVPSSAGPCLMLGKYERFGTQIVELILNQAPTKSDEKHLSSIFSSSLKIVNDNCPDDEPSVRPKTQTGGLPNNSVKNLSRDEISNYLTVIHSTLEKKLTCSNVANETRRVLDCDRVSVLLKHRGKFRLFAISGQPSVNRRSNTSKLLEELSRKILKTGQAFWYPDESEFPPQISSTLDDYLALTATRSLIVDPIFDKLPERVEDPESNERKSNPVIGGIVYEHCNELWSRQAVAPTIEFTTQHSGNAVRNADKHHRLFLYPVWNLLGKSKVLTAPRILPKSLLVLGALLLTSLILIFWQVEFSVTAEGVLLPKELMPVYARVDGDLDQLFVDHGSVIKKGQVLAKLKSPSQELNMKEIESNLNQAKQRLESIEDRRFEKNDDPAAVEENINSLKSQIASFESQLEILAAIAGEMTVKSPMNGSVITWDLRRQLTDRPIQRGNVLMEIANLEGEWELELHLEDRRIGHLRNALQRSEDNRLPVTFLLAANTSERLTGTLVEIAPTTEVTADNEQSIKLRVEIDSSQINIDQARTEITGKIICGRSSLGYYLLHDIKEFFHKNVQFYFL